MMEKVIDITERVPAMRKRRKRRTNLKFAFLTTIFLFIILLLLYFQSPYSDMKEINIQGSNLMDEAFYLNQSGLVVDESMWGFKIGDIEKEIAKNDWIKSVEVQRKFVNTVQITIEEWHKVAYISREGDFYPMLENGIIFNESSEMVPVDAPIFLEFEDESLRKKILKQLALLKPEVLALISQINTSSLETDPYAITLFMNDGYEVRAEVNSLAEKLNYYPSIIAQIENEDAFEKGIIDIEVGSYYRPFSEEYAIKIPVEGEEIQEEGQADEQQSTD